MSDIDPRTPHGPPGEGTPTSQLSPLVPLVFFGLGLVLLILYGALSGGT